MAHAVEFLDRAESARVVLVRLRAELVGHYDAADFGAIDGIEIAFQVVTADGIDSFQQLRVAETDDIWPETYCRAIFLVEELLSAFAVAVVDIEETPDIGEFGRKRPGDVIERGVDVCPEERR